MSRFRGTCEAFGKPGLPPRWSPGNKDGVATAYSADSRIWFTLHDGAVAEIYYPLIDRPQVRDLQLLVSDGNTSLHDERRHLLTRTERRSPHGLGYRVINSNPEGSYRLEKELIAEEPRFQMSASAFPGDSCGAGSPALKGRSETKVIRLRAASMRRSTRDADFLESGQSRVIPIDCRDRRLITPIALKERGAGQLTN